MRVCSGPASALTADCTPEKNAVSADCPSAEWMNVASPPVNCTSSPSRMLPNGMAAWKTPTRIEPTLIAISPSCFSTSSAAWMIFGQLAGLLRRSGHPPVGGVSRVSRPWAMPGRNWEPTAPNRTNASISGLMAPDSVRPAVSDVAEDRGELRPHALQGGQRRFDADVQVVGDPVQAGAQNRQRRVRQVGDRRTHPGEQGLLHVQAQRRSRRGRGRGPG
jgi:hypothetical protein